MELQSLISLSQNEAEDILRKNKLDYVIVEIAGGKDEALLTESYVVRAKAIDNKIELVVTKFKTNI